MEAVGGTRVFVDGGEVTSRVKILDLDLQYDWPPRPARVPTESKTDRTPPQWLFHVTEVENRCSIARFGLLPAKPVCDGRYMDARSLHMQPRGVYGTRELQIDRWHLDGETCDHWLIDARGLEMKVDPYLGPQAWVIPSRVAPGRLYLIDDESELERLDGRVEVDIPLPF